MLEGILIEFQNKFQDLKYFKSSLKFCLNTLKINNFQGEVFISSIIISQKISRELESIEIQKD